MLAFYVGIDIANVNPYDERITLFLTNLRDRGDENYRKKVYMWALTCDKMEKYKSKIDQFLNKFYLDITSYKKPVLSAFQDDLIRFFLNVHLGYDNYPEFMITYFKRFIEITGTIDRTLDNCPWVDKMIYGYITTPQVEEYINNQLKIIIDNQDDTCILYYWYQAGLAVQAILTECLHNMVALNQYTNTLFLMIVDRISGTVTPGGPTISYNFADKFSNAAGSEEDQLNVIREMYRLLVPNSISFSRTKQEVVDTNLPLKSDHIQKLIMITQTGPAYFGYNPTIYDTDYRTSFSDCTNPAPPVPVPVPTFNPDTYFEISTVDNETVQPISNNKIIPVFPAPNAPGTGQPTYYPFGFGYRRCAGEVFNYYVTLMMVEKLQFLFNAPSLGGLTRFAIDSNLTDTISPAPFTFVPNNIILLPDN